MLQAISSTHVLPGFLVLLHEILHTEILLDLPIHSKIISNLWPQILKAERITIGDIEGFSIGKGM
jgi:hypothetical protein